jgi:hypothetical protein
LVIATGTACEAAYGTQPSPGIDELSIALTDGTTFDTPLENAINAACGFAADLGVP